MVSCVDQTLFRNVKPITRGIQHSFLGFSPLRGILHYENWSNWFQDPANFTGKGENHQCFKNGGNMHLSWRRECVAVSAGGAQTFRRRQFVAEWEPWTTEPQCERTLSTFQQLPSEHEFIQLVKPEKYNGNKQSYLFPCEMKSLASRIQDFLMCHFWKKFRKNLSYSYTRTCK